MTLDKAIRLAHKWAAGQVCTLREGEAQEYHQLCAEALERSRWIPVTERLPEDNVQVLACTKHGKAFSAHCENGKWRVSGSVKVTHWMPLPNKPKEECENDVS